MNDEIHVLKDEENQLLIPSVWRNTFREIVEAFKDRDFQLSRGIADVQRLSPEDAERIAKNLERYAARLASLPGDTWGTSACQWMGGYWDALIDLYPVEEGASDLVLAIRVYEAALGYHFHVMSVHVP